MKERLLQRRRRLLARYDDELARAHELEAREIEQIETAAEQWDARVLSRLSDADAVALARVVGALRRLERGSYGVCVSCDTKIERSRLRAVPETETCYACAVRVEAA